MNGLSRGDVQTLQGTVEDLWVWFLEALDFGDRYVVERGCDAQDVDLSLLDIRAAVRNDGQPVPGLG